MGLKTAAQHESGCTGGEHFPCESRKDALASIGALGIDLDRSTSVMPRRPRRWPPDDVPNALPDGIRRRRHRNNAGPEESIPNLRTMMSCSVIPCSLSTGRCQGNGREADFKRTMQSVEIQSVRPASRAAIASRIRHGPAGSDRWPPRLRPLHGQPADHRTACAGFDVLRPDRTVLMGMSTDGHDEIEVAIDHVVDRLNILRCPRLPRPSPARRWD